MPSRADHSGGVSSAYMLLMMREVKGACSILHSAGAAFIFWSSIWLKAAQLLTAGTEGGLRCRFFSVRALAQLSFLQLPRRVDKIISGGYWFLGA